MRPFCSAAGISARTVIFRLMLAVVALVAVSLPFAADADPVTWLVPAGGEVWTAGTTHTIEWSGGGPSVGAVAFFEQFPPFGSAPLPSMAFFPNNGHGFWSIPDLPSYLPPGTYKLAIGFANDTNSPYYSNTFTIVPPPECLSGCERVSASFPVPAPFYSALPNGACGYGPFSATSAAESYIQAQLASQCFPGYSINPGSLVIDVTLLPFGSCMLPESAPFVAEASGFGCCCPDVVPAKHPTWGTLKSIYR